MLLLVEHILEADTMPVLGINVNNTPSIKPYNELGFIETFDAHSHYIHSNILANCTYRYMHYYRHMHSDYINNYENYKIYIIA